MTGLSVVVITLNEERDLPACLASVKDVADEIVVVDNHSTDATREVAKRFGAKTVTRTFDHYAGQKQFAVDQGSREWVLSIDADERVTPELAAELRRIVAEPGPFEGFVIPFEVEFMGRVLRWGGLGSETHLRLFRREAGRFVGGGLHEGIECRAPCGRTAGRIRHIPYDGLDEYFAKLGRYTTLAARKRRQAGCRAHLGHHLLPFWELFVRLVLRLGLLDGTPGVVYAGLSAFHTWTKYVKLAEMEKER